MCSGHSPSTKSHVSTCAYLSVSASPPDSYDPAGHGNLSGAFSLSFLTRPLAYDQFLRLEAQVIHNVCSRGSSSFKLGNTLCGVAYKTMYVVPSPPLAWLLSTSSTCPSPIPLTTSANTRLSLARSHLGRRRLPWTNNQNHQAELIHS